MDELGAKGKKRVGGQTFANISNLCCRDPVISEAQNSYQQFWGTILSILGGLLFSDFTSKRKWGFVVAACDAAHQNSISTTRLVRDLPQVPDVQPAVGATGGQYGFIVGRPLNLQTRMNSEMKSVGRT